MNSKYKLCVDKGEAVNYIISEYCKLAQMEYKNRVDKKVSTEDCARGYTSRAYPRK